MKLNFLTEAELLGRFEKLVRTERKITHLVLECIAEIDRRKIYLEKSYSSLYDFLTKGYGYSPSAAMRRIESARLLREVPTLTAQIEDGSLNLTQLCQVQQAVRLAKKQENRTVSVSEKQILLAQIQNTTQVETQIILSRELGLEIPAVENRTYHRDASMTLTIHLTNEERLILEKAKDLLAHALPEQSWGTFLKYLAEKEIEKRTKISKKNLSAGLEKTERKNNSSKTRKKIHLRVRKAVFSEQTCCQYQDPSTGLKCGSQKFLQIDHIQPVWAGGGNDLGNLRILCSQHNRYIYQKQLKVKLI